MSDYTKVYDGAAKDTAESTLAGADFDVDFDAIETAIATKVDKISGHTTNSIGLIDVNGNLISSEILIDTDGTLAGNSDSAISTEKAVKTYVDTEVAAISEETFVTGTFTIGAVAALSLGTVKIAHGLGDVPVDFGGTYFTGSGLVEDVRLFCKEGGNTYRVIVDQNSHANYSEPSLVNGEIGVIAYNNSATFAETSVTINWWVRLR